MEKNKKRRIRKAKPEKESPTWEGEQKRPKTRREVGDNQNWEMGIGYRGAGNIEGTQKTLTATNNMHIEARQKRNRSA